MKKHLLFGLILILGISCQDKKSKYNSEAIELNNNACELMKLGLNDSALILLNKATTLDSTYYTAFINKVEIYYQSKDYKKALIEAENILKVKPDFAEAWTYSGMLYEIFGDSTKAKIYYEKSVDLFEQRIKNSKDKNSIISNRLNKAFSNILLGNENEGRKELFELKEKYKLNIDYYLTAKRSDLVNDIFNQE